ncbi:MAG: hypothetical protein V7603_5080 [Micromonosporaceae bacterium]
MTPHPRLGLLAAMATFMLLAATACSHGEPSTPPGSPAASNAAPSPSTDSRVQQESAKVLAAYSGYNEAYVAAAATANFDDKALPRYVADPLLAELRFALRQQSEQGIVYQGKPTWAAKITKINVAERPFSATISNCFDNGSWTPIYKSTRKPVPAPTQAKRYVVTSTAKFYDNGRWLISEAKADRSRPC